VNSQGRKETCVLGRRLLRLGGVVVPHKTFHS